MSASNRNSTGYTCERARVIAVERECLWVETFRASTCGQCEAQSHCGQGVLGRWFSRDKQCLRVLCADGEAQLFTVGQWVDIGIPDGLVMQASLVTYLTPLAGMFVGAIAMSTQGGDVAVLGGMIGGLMVGLLAVRAYARLRFTDPRSHPRLLEGTLAS